MGKPTVQEYRERIAKGIKLLDEKAPEWWDLIDLDTLDVASGKSCVTAQTYKGLTGNVDEEAPWIAGGEMLGLDPQGDGVNDYILHGFNAETGHIVVDYATGNRIPGWEGYDYEDAIHAINGIWAGEISKRQAATDQ